VIITVTVFKGKARIENSGDNLKVYTNAPRENNRANYDIIRQLSKCYQTDYSKIKLVSGSKSRKKIFSIETDI
jgi:uncharacterized protein YggU (UPF0235/DUF167 family)